MNTRTCGKLLHAAVLVAILSVTVTLLSPRANAAAEPCSAPSASSKCAITILSPGTGGALNNDQNVGPSIVVSFTVKNFTLVQPGTVGDVNTTTTGGGAHNEGHIHVFVDNKYVTLWHSSNGIPLSLQAGTHTIKLELVNDFHQSFSPEISATTTVMVADPTGSAASMAQNYGLGALIVSVITLILVAYVAFRPKKTTA